MADPERNILWPGEYNFKTCGVDFKRKMTVETEIMHDMASDTDGLAEESESELKRRNSRKKRSSKRVSKKLTESEEKEIKKRLSTSNRRVSKSHIWSDSDLFLMNPFQTNESMDGMEQFKLYVLGLVLIPIRFLLFLLVCLIATVFMVLTVVGCDVDKPLPPARANAQRMIATVSGYVMCGLLGLFNIKVEGEKAHGADCRLLVIAPHSTIMDALIVGAVMGGPSGVGKAELGDSILGPYLRAVQTIFVDREDGNNRAKVLQQIKERAEEGSAWRRQLAIFPEGTCTNRSSLIQFKKGSFEPGVPVQPVTLKWQYTSFDPSWTAGSPNRFRIVMRCFAQFRQDVTVHFLPIYYPSDEEKADPALFANNVRKKMAKDLNVTTSEFSTPDMFLAKVAAKKKLQPAFALPFTFAALLKETKDLDVKKVLPEVTKTLLLRFSKAPKMTPDARMNAAQFEKIAKKAASDIMLETPLEWSAFVDDVREDGTISFHAFLLGHLKAKYSTN